MMSKEYFLGNKKHFAIDFQLLRTDPGLFGYLNLWINNNAIGRDDDPVFVYSVLVDLEWIVSRDVDIESENICHLSTSDAWLVLESLSGSYRLSPIEFFDDYIIYAVRDGNSVRLLWRLIKHEKVGEIRDSIVPIKYIKDVVMEFRRIYDTLCPYVG